MRNRNCTANAVCLIWSRHILRERLARSAVLICYNKSGYRVSIIVLGSLYYTNAPDLMGALVRSRDYRGSVYEIATLHLVHRS